MIPNPFLPILAVYRGSVMECVHNGAIAVTDRSGKLHYSYGDPCLVTFLRSSAKPFQIIPFVEIGGVEKFGLTDRELAIMCASHSGTDEHVAVLRGIHSKIGIRESELQCGVHPPYHKPTAKALLLNGEEPTPLRHNCSGKHTGMLALARMLGAPTETYLEMQNPVQQVILKAFSEMVDIQPEQIQLGTDGCSAPVFAVPLQNSAMGFARLVDPQGLAKKREEACRKITRAMTQHPEMVAGAGMLDSEIMREANGGIIVKAGAEGFLALGIRSGGIASDAPALGIAIKIGDGDIGGKFRPGAETNEGRVRPIVVMETLKQLHALTPQQTAALSKFAARPQYNWRGIEVGRFEPIFELLQHA